MNLDKDWLDDDFFNNISVKEIFETYDETELNQLIGVDVIVNGKHSTRSKRFENNKAKIVKMWERPYSSGFVIVVKFYEPGVGTQHASGASNAWGFGEDGGENISFTFLY
jgi:hypothetical protein